jgi:hypothetical protein
MSFDPLKYLFEALGFHEASNFQSGNPFGNANVIPRLHFQPTPFHAFALFVNPKLRP